MPETNPLNLTDEDRINEFLSHVSHAGAELPSGYKDGIALLLENLNQRTLECADIRTHRDQLRRDLDDVIKAIQPEEPTIQGCVDALQVMRENWERDLRTIDALRDEVFDTATERDRYKKALEHIADVTKPVYGFHAAHIAHRALHPSPPTSDA